MGLVIIIAAILMVVCVATMWAAINYSMPAPDWYEQEEYYRDRYRWYK